MAVYQWHTRLALRRDLDAIVAIEYETFGAWTKPEFERVLTTKNVVCYVTSMGNEQGEQVLGFVVLQMGRHACHVLNMAAMNTEARKRLIAKAEQRADRYGSQLVWEGSGD